MKSDQQSQKETKKTEKEFKETAVSRDENHRIELYEHAPIGIVECSLDGRYMNLNEDPCLEFLK